MLAVGLYNDEEVPEGLSGEAGKILSDGDFSGKEGQSVLIYSPNGLKTPRLLLVGLGERAYFGLEKLRRVSANVAKRACALKLDEAAFALPISEGSGIREATEAATEGVILGLYRFDRYKSNTE